MSVKPWAVKGLVPVQHSALKKAIASLQTLAEVSPQLFFQLQNDYQTLQSSGRSFEIFDNRGFKMA